MPRILIVDDNRHLLRAYRENLEREGHEVLTANAVDEARAMLASRKIDLVVMELRMGGYVEFEFLSDLAARRLPVIVNTAFEEFRWDFRTWYAEALVLKSSDHTALQNAVQNVCSKAHAVYERV